MEFVGLVATRAFQKLRENQKLLFQLSLTFVSHFLLWLADQLVVILCRFSKLCHNLLKRHLLKRHLFKRHLLMVVTKLPKMDNLCQFLTQISRRLALWHCIGLLKKYLCSKCLLANQLPHASPPTRATSNHLLFYLCGMRHDPR